MLRAFRFPLILALLASAAASAALWPATALAQNKDKNKDKDRRELVAVLDLGILGGTPVEAAALTNQLRAELLRTGKLTLVDRSQMDEILKEQALQQSGCTSQECAVKVGQILGVSKIVTGVLAKISPDLWQVSVQLVNVETSQTLRAEVYTHEGDYKSLLLKGMARVALALTSGVAPPRLEEVASGKPNWAFWWGLSTVTVGLAVGNRAQADAQDARDGAKKSRESNNSRKYDSANSDMDLAKSRANGANALFVIGGGLLFYYWLAGDDEASAATLGPHAAIAALPLSLTVEPQAAWIGWTVRW